ncbi:DUF1868 domain-containing protein, partial [Bacillaceae bacterium SIJ1]|uniref:DUF1868 domain-containing protein n=1 Tax=Litoribacterium kuwaitense TaxID=1398745 RepID=UPI0013ECBD9F
MIQFTDAVGSTKKFNEEGRLKWFPGNTIVCNLYEDTKVIEKIKEIQAAYQKLSCAHKFSMMPMSSIHMTVFELLCHFNRTPEKWSEFLNIDEDLEHIDQF